MDALSGGVLMVIGGAFLIVVGLACWLSEGWGRVKVGSRD